MTDIQKENKSGGKVPNLRFPEFKEGWEVKKLGEICEMRAGKFIVASEIYDKPNDSLFPCFGGNGLRGYTKSFNKEGTYSLIGRQGALCGNVTLANGKFYATEHAVIVEPNENADTIWMFYLLTYLNLNQYATGMAQPGLSVQNLEKIEIVFPKSKKEQQKTASFLSKIDERIRTQNKIIEQLETLIKGLSENLFSQKIRFKKFEKKWEVKTLGEILIEINERTINSNQYRVLSSTAKGLFYQSDYFNKEVASKDNAGYKILKINQLVFSPQNLWLGNINVNTTYEIGIVSPSYKVFSFNEKAIVSYCKYFLKSSKMMFEYEQCSEQGASIVRRNLNMDLFLNIPILLPKLEEQIQISSFLTKIDQKIQTEKAILEQLEIQKKYLLQQMFV